MSQTKILVIRTVLLLLLTQLSGAAAAQGLESPGSRLVGERPNAAGEATAVSVSLYVIDIDAIDDVNQRFSVDMFINVAWQDSRLALPEDQRLGQSRTFPLADIWTPRGLIVNDRGLSPQLPQVADVDDLGNVQRRQRLSGELAVDLNLEEFPFDTQLLSIDVISYQYSPGELRLSAPIGLILDERPFSAAGWRFKKLDPELGEFRISAAGISRPRLTFFIQAQRESQYFMLTALLPMSLIVFMSWTVFWLPPNVIPARVGISTASIFSLIAFGLSVRLSLPAVSYMTRADTFLIGCMLMVFLALGVAVLGSRWASVDRLEDALRLNAAARWVYVLLFVAVVAGATVV